MNVCALDSIARSREFDSLASGLQLRPWEWDFLHAVDGEATVGTISGRLGLDLDSSIGFVHEAQQRGLLDVVTMTLETYRHRTPSSNAVPPAAAQPMARVATSVPIAEPAKAGAISFSSDAFDWNAPEPTFDEAAEVPDESATPAAPVEAAESFGHAYVGGHIGSVPHEGEATHAHDETATVTEAPTYASHAHADEFAAPASNGVASGIESSTYDHAEADTQTSAYNGGTAADNVTPYEVSGEHTPYEASYEHAPQPEAPTATHYADAFAAPPDTAPWETPVTQTSAQALSESVAKADPTEHLVTWHNAAEPVGPAPWEPTNTGTPYAGFSAAQPGHDEPSYDDAAHGDHADAETTQTDPAYLDDAHDAATYAQRAPADSNAHATAAPAPSFETMPRETANVGSISFSFSNDEPLEDGLQSYEPVPNGTPHTPPAAEVVQPPSNGTSVEHTHADGAGRELEGRTSPRVNDAPAADPASPTYAMDEQHAPNAAPQPVASWKDSLSWREQQDIRNATEAGREKDGVISSFLRALGVR